MIAEVSNTLVEHYPFSWLAAGGTYLQLRQGPGSRLTQEHPAMAPFYVVRIIMEWALLYHLWVRFRRQKQIGILGLVMGRWTGVKSALVDLVMAVPFWFF